MGTHVSAYGEASAGLVASACDTCKVVAGSSASADERHGPLHGPAPAESTTALALACYGSTRIGPLADAYSGLVNRVQGAAPDVHVELAVVSGHVRRDLSAHGFAAPSLVRVLDGFAADKVRRVAVQPVLVGEGVTLDEVAADVKAAQGRFGALTLGDPLLSDATDAIAVACGVREAFPATSDAPVLLVGHGSQKGNRAYQLLADVLDRDGSVPQGAAYLVATLDEGAQKGVARLRAAAPDAHAVTLVPFMLVAGAHARGQIAGDGPGSWYSALVQSGYAVDVREQGLLELPAVRKVLVDHAVCALGAL